MKIPRAVLAACLACALAAGPAGAAVERKVLRISFRTAETGFDPQRVFDRYSVGICESLFEPLLTYRLNPWTVFYVGATSGYADYGRRDDLDLPTEAGLVQTSRQFFLKFQYLLRF